MDLKKIAAKAEESTFYNWLMNRVLWRVVPFNKPHGFWVKNLNERQTTIEIPYRKNNMNHLKGLHACGLATAGEYASGLLLLYHLDPKQYRLIMRDIAVDYNYQGKMKALAQFDLAPDTVESRIKVPLKSADSVDFHCEIPIKDEAGNLLCTVRTNWQIKSWDKAKVKA